MKKLGIIGGMGPAATMYFASRIIELTQASSDQEHLDITVLNRPWIPDRSAYIKGEACAAPFYQPIAEAAIQLERMGCRVLCMPCNTAHAYELPICDVLKRARFISMPGEVAQIVARKGYERIGILATSGTQLAHVYENALRNTGAHLVWLDNHLQDELMETIYCNIKRGVASKPSQIDRFIHALLLRNCEAMIIGCTELSMLLKSHQNLEMSSEASLALPTIDALDALAVRCIQECGAQIRFEAISPSETWQTERMKICAG